jgi:hypothetical protein
MLATTLGWLSIALQVGVLAGLVWRGRWRRLLLLPALLVAVAAPATVTLVWPSTHTWRAWLMAELTHALLLFLMGLELALLLFRRLPEARRDGRLWIASVLVSLGPLLATTPWQPLMTAVLPRLTVAVAWLYGGLLFVCVLHAVPVDPLHKTVLRGFVTYLLVYSLGWGFTGTDTRIIGIVNAITFDVLMIVMLRAAWRPDVPVGVGARTVDYFWPWRQRERVRYAPSGWPRLARLSL